MSFMYLALRRLIELVALRLRSAEYKELKIVVLRHGSRSCVAKSRGRLSGRPIAPFWLPQPCCCPGGAGRRSSSPRRPCFVGIAQWSRAIGPIQAGDPAARGSVPRSVRSS